MHAQVILIVNFMHTYIQFMLLRKINHEIKPSNLGVSSIYTTPQAWEEEYGSHKWEFRVKMIH